MTRSGSTRRGAWRGKGPGTCVSGSLRLLLRVTWLLSLRLAALPPSLNLPGGSGPAWLADTGPSLILLEHHPAPESGEGMETLDLVRIGADGSPHWSRVWPTPQENPRHAGLELWMAAYGHQIVGRPTSWFDWRDGNNR
jgi:hypothetical protein